MGSAAAYHLARRGEPFVLIEQFALGHDRGSSHGAARITRPLLCRSSLRPLDARGLSRLARARGRCGRIALYPHRRRLVLPGGVDYAARVAANLAELDVPAWRGSGARLERQMPDLSFCRRQYDVVFEPDAGMLRAARAVAFSSRWPE